MVENQTKAELRVKHFSTENRITFGVKREFTRTESGENECLLVHNKLQLNRKPLILLQCHDNQ